MTISQIATRVGKFASDNSPLILTVVGVSGTITTAVLTGKAAYKSSKVLEDERYKRRLNGEPEQTAKEKFLEVWPYFVPAVGTGAMTVTAIIMANRIGTKRAAAVAAAYSISEKAFEEYREKVIEKLGPNKERDARDELAQERVTKNPSSQQEVVIASGNVLCYELWAGRYFESTMEEIKKAQNDLNYMLLNNGYASLNDLYDKLGLDRTVVGEEMGWNSDKLMEIKFTTTISDDQRPCIAIDFDVQPVRNYFRVH